MTKTYSELRQAVLFRAARDLRAVAASVLDDVQNEVELTSSQTLDWAVSVARKTALLANELESRGHEEAIATGGANAHLSKSKNRYSKAIDAFEERIRAAGGTVPAGHVHRTVNPV